MNTLRAQRQALQEQLRGLAAELKRAKRQKREADESDGGERPQSDPVILQTAEIVYHLSHGDRDAASEYFQLARRNWPTRGAGLPPHCLDVWARRGPETVRELLEGRAADARQRQRAREFLSQRQLRAWVTEQNVVKACAPRPRDVLDEVARRGVRDGAGAADGGRSRSPARPRRRLQQWVRRWSRRFRLHRGRFRAAARLTAADALLKAA